MKAIHHPIEATIGEVAQDNKKKHTNNAIRGLERQEYMKKRTFELKVFFGKVILVFVNLYSRKTSRYRD